MASLFIIFLRRCSKKLERTVLRGSFTHGAVAELIFVCTKANLYHQLPRCTPMGLIRFKILLLLTALKEQNPDILRNKWTKRPAMTNLDSLHSPDFNSVERQMNWAT